MPDVTPPGGGLSPSDVSENTTVSVDYIADFSKDANLINENAQGHTYISLDDDLSLPNQPELSPYYWMPKSGANILNWPNGFSRDFFDFSDDGQYLFYPNGNTVQRASLSTPWDITTASYDHGRDVGSDFGTVFGITVSHDGEYAIVGGDGYARSYDISNYDLTTISTGSYTTWGASNLTRISDMSWSPFGDIVVAVGLNNYLNVFDTGKFHGDSPPSGGPYDFERGSESSIEFDRVVGSDGTGNLGAVSFSPDGSELIVLDQDGWAWRISLETPFNPGSYRETTRRYRFGDGGGTWRGLVFHPDGKTAFSTNRSVLNGELYELRTGPTPLTGECVVQFGPSPPSSKWGEVEFGVVEDGGSVSVDVVAPEPSVRQFADDLQGDVHLDANDDDAGGPVAGELRGLAVENAGSELYIGDTQTSVHQYTLNTPWDPSDNTFSQTLDVSNNVGTVGGVDMSNDGTLLFVADSSSRNVDTYTLSTPYDISTAAHTSTFDTFMDGYGGINSEDIQFSGNGEHFYTIVRYSSEESGVHHYTLSTPYDLTSTVTWQENVFFYGMGGTFFNNTAERQRQYGYTFTISEDGRRLLIGDDNDGYLSEYILDVPYDLETARVINGMRPPVFTNYHSDGYDEVRGTPYGMAMNPDGGDVLVAFGRSNNNQVIDNRVYSIDPGGFETPTIGKDWTTIQRDIQSGTVLDDIGVTGPHAYRVRLSRPNTNSDPKLKYIQRRQLL